jgi:hypothetical protein
MKETTRLKTLLIRAGLSLDEADFYAFVLENPGCTIADVYKKTGISKSSAYRIFEHLSGLDLLKTASNSWQTELRALPLEGLIRKLENEQRSKKRLITELKILNTPQMLGGISHLPSIQSFEGDEIFEKYHELSQMNFDTNLVFGSWEDFSYDVDLVSIEKKFVKNRMKNGGNAIVLITKDGPNTDQIVDNDPEEDRFSKLVPASIRKPIWINAFEGNNLVYMWNKDERGKHYATLIDSREVADFYKNFIYSHSV